MLKQLKCRYIRIKRFLVLGVLSFFAGLQRKHGWIIVLPPFLRFKGLAIAALFDDAVEVMRRDDVFRVSYGPSMMYLGDGRNFILGMENSPEYRQDMQNLREVIQRSDWDTHIRPSLEREAEAALAACNGQLDIVDGYFKRIMGATFARYFGLSGTASLNWPTWGFRTFAHNFANGSNDAEIREPAVIAKNEASAVLRKCLLERIGIAQKEKWSEKHFPKLTVLDRLAVLHLNRRDGLLETKDIIVNMLGMMSGYLVPTCWVSPQIIDYFLSNPAQLELARQAVGTDLEPLAKCLFEAERFRPMSSIIPRIAKTDFILAQDTSRAKKISGGATVVVATQSAMFDPRQVERPDEYLTNRPLSVYLHEGYGLHTCFGKYLNPWQMPVLFKPLLKRKFTRVPGSAGKLSTDVAGLPARLEVVLN